VFLEAKDDGGGDDNWTTGAISRAKLQSNHHHQQINIFLLPNQQCQNTEGKISHSMDLLTLNKICNKSKMFKMLIVFKG